MIINSFNFLKSNFYKYQYQHQYQSDRLKVSKKNHAPSRFFRYSTFLAAGLTCLILGSVATPATAQPRIIEQFGDINSPQNIRVIQTTLNRLGYGVTVDGVLGNETRTALLNFQRDNNLPITGVVDNITANRIFANVQENIRNNPQDIRAIQDGLRRLGYNITVDGILGPRTQQALSSFQQNYNLPVTGEADFTTSNAIFNRTSTNIPLPSDGNRERFCRDHNNRNQVCAYVVLIPGDNNRLTDIKQRLLATYPPLAQSMVLEDHSRGLFIRINQYFDRQEAENVANMLRNNISPDFRVEFLPIVAPISARG